MDRPNDEWLRSTDAQLRAGPRIVPRTEPLGAAVDGPRSPSSPRRAAMGPEVVRSLRGPRTEVWTVDELLPRRMLPLSVFNAWVDPRRPYPPIRGWVMQQIVKFGAAAELGVDLLVLADSDVVLVRPVTIDTFRNDGRVRFYRSEGAVDERLPRHLLWHEVARKLLGLPPPSRHHSRTTSPHSMSGIAGSCWRCGSGSRPSPGGPGWTRSRPSSTSPSSSSTECSWTRCSARPLPVIPEDSMLCHSHWGPEPMADATVPVLRPVAATGGCCGDDLRALGYRAGCATKGAVRAFAPVSRLGAEVRDSSEPASSADSRIRVDGNALSGARRSLAVHSFIGRDQSSMKGLARMGQVSGNGGYMREWLMALPRPCARQRRGR